MKKPRSARIVVLLVSLLIAFGVAEATTSNLLLILDASGSMWGQIDGENKIVIAREVLGDLSDGLDDGTQVGLIAYGHRREGDCDDIETVIPIAPLDKASLKETVGELSPKGKTPITKSVQQAFASLEDRAEGTTVILVSDGLETCGGDPCAAVRKAKESGIDFVMHVVGFDVAGEDVSSLECAAQAGDGLFFSAEDAEQLSAALEAAVEMPAEAPAGRLAVKVVADGELQDAAVSVARADSGEDAGGGRTYVSAETNPRVIPLADGAYKVKVAAVGIKGANTRYFDIEISDGATVEKEIDYSTGSLSIGVTRNGELSDAVVKVLVPDTNEQAASGRTYTSSQSNPKSFKLTAGTYLVRVGSVEITGRPWADLGTVEVAPGGSVEVAHDFSSGTLKIGSERDGQLVDATLNVVDVDSGKSVGGGRTYTSPSSNPKEFLLEPGTYEITVSEIRGEKTQFTVEVGQGEMIERIVDPAAD